MDALLVYPAFYLAVKLQFYCHYFSLAVQNFNDKNEVEKGIRKINHINQRKRVLILVVFVKQFILNVEY